MGDLVGGLLHPLTGRFFDKRRMQFVFLWEGKELGMVTAELAEQFPEALQGVENGVWQGKLMEFGASFEKV